MSVIKKLGNQLVIRTTTSWSLHSWSLKFLTLGQCLECKFLNVVMKNSFFVSRLDYNRIRGKTAFQLSAPTPWRTWRSSNGQGYESPFYWVNGWIKERIHQMGRVSLTVHERADWASSTLTWDEEVLCRRQGRRCFRRPATYCMGGISVYNGN